MKTKGNMYTDDTNANCCDQDTPIKVDESCQMEMPRYKCYKEVWALKIGHIQPDSDLARKEGRETDGSAIITPTDIGYGPFRVESDYVKKHNPQVGGYYVVYNDGYKSFSPAKAFESGYVLSGREPQA